VNEQLLRCREGQDCKVWESSGNLVRLWIQDRWLFVQDRQGRECPPVYTILPVFNVGPPYSSLSYSHIRCISGPDHLHATKRLNRGFPAPSSTTFTSWRCPSQSGGCVSDVEQSVTAPVRAVDGEKGICWWSRDTIVYALEP